MPEPVKMFVGIKVPDDISESLRGFRDDCSSVVEGVQWIEPPNLHVTLRFLGLQTEQTVRPIAAALSKICVSPVDITIGDGAIFEDVGVLVVDVEPSPGLVELQAAVDQIALLNGVSPAQYAYRPHVSIARLNSASKTCAISAGFFHQTAVELGQFCREMPRQHFRPTEMALFTSIGGHYRGLQNFDFGCRFQD